MKVIQILPELSSGGVERGTLELAEHLTSHGHESVVISGGGRLVEPLTSGGTRHITLPVGRKSPGSLKLIRPLRKLFREEAPDIVHLRSRVPAWLAWLAWRKLPVSTRPRLVTTVHGFYSVNRWSEIMCRGERVICVSDSIRRYVMEHYPRTAEEVLRVIPRGVSPADYPYGFVAGEDWKSKFETEFPAIQGKKLVTLPGRITRLKGHEDLIKIMSGLADRPDIHALIVGGAHPRKAEYLKELTSTITREGLADRITFTGNRDDLRNILSVSALVLSLTRQPESFGRTTLEALAMGIPVAGYAHGGVAEQLDCLYPEGRITPLDPIDASAVLRRLIDEPPPVRKPNPFTLTRMLEDTVNVYGELLGKR
jgi:glycosyltransferase involved in cell wall biosynthesis